MSYDPNNIFAKILRGEIPCHKVHEDEHTLAFMDVMPQADGHTLVIPKSPSRNLLDADPGRTGPAHGLGAEGRRCRAQGLRRGGHPDPAVQRAGGGPDGVPPARPHPAAQCRRFAPAPYRQDGGPRSCSPGMRR